MNTESQVGSTGLVFPGQGSQAPDMFQAFSHLDVFRESVEQLNDLLELDFVAMADEHSLPINDNVVSSVCTVLASVCALEMYHSNNEERPSVLAGFSVGQWSALYASGVVSREMLFNIVVKRAQIMDSIVNVGAASGMLAVIGVRLDNIQSACDKIREGDDFVSVANYNAPNQYTLSGTIAGLAKVQNILREFHPKKMARIPVAGAWHSELLRESVHVFRDFLSGIELNRPQIPVLSNVTGKPLDPDSFLSSLSEHLASPVRWQNCIETMITSFDISQCIEIGYGNMLTKFGFFIDRRVKHCAMFPPPRRK